MPDLQHHSDILMTQNVCPSKEGIFNLQRLIILLLQIYLGSLCFVVHVLKNRQVNFPPWRDARMGRVVFNPLRPSIKGSTGVSMLINREQAGHKTYN